MAKKARKWSNLKGQIPDDPSQVEVSDWMKKVLVSKDARATNTMDEMAKEWAELQAKDAEAAEKEKARNIIYRALELRILEELEKVKEIAGTDMWRGENQTFSPRFTPRPVITDPAALMKWIKDTDQRDQLTLPNARLKSIICEALDTSAAAVLTPAQRAELKPGDPASGAPPPGVSVFLQTTVHHTGGKTPPPETGPEEGPF